MPDRVYIETTIPSYLTAKPSRDLVTQARQQITRDWWLNRKDHYELFCSDVVVAEAARGDPQAANRRLSAIQNISRLELNNDCLQLAEDILAKIAVPQRASDDALHIAVATVHNMDYLVTWNFRHLANPHNYKALRALCRNKGFKMPEICAPEALF